MRQSRKISLTLNLITTFILLGMVVLKPMMASSQPTRRMNISRESGRDPFVLPPGVRLLSNGDTNAVIKGTVSSRTPSTTEIKPKEILLKVTAILISDHIRLASIDGSIVTVGDSIHDQRILEIKNDRVVLGKGDRRRTLLLSQSPVQLTVERK